MIRPHKVAFARAILSIAFLGSLSCIAEALPKCNDVCIRGFNACLDWCNAHNKTDASNLKCGAQCNKYWLSGKNPQSIGRPDPVNPTTGITPPGLKNPPTTVSDPTPPSHRPVAPVKPVDPVTVSNPNSGNNAPVILLRENGSGGQGRGHK
jgi:hypothetical protein